MLRLQPRFVHIPVIDLTVASSHKGMMAAGTLLFLFVLSGCVEPYPIWKKLDQAPFPITVDGLVTGNRHVLSRQHMLTYEGWRVSFGADAPSATANANCSWSVRCEVQIKQLTCETKTGSRETCSLHLDTLDEACELFIERSGEKVGIDCPVDIIFDATKEKVTVMRPSSDPM